MAERKESSVLFSLRELRSIEEERVQEEESARQAAEEARIRAAQEAEARARAEEEARRRAIEEAERQERESRERTEREERLRVEEAERRARVEAHAQLEQHRLAKELEIRAMEAQRKRPTALIAIAVVLVLAVGGLGFFAYHKSQESEQKEKAFKAQLAQIEKQISDTQTDLDRLNKEKDAQFQRLLAAKTQEEKDAAQKALSEKRAQIRAKQDALNKLKKRAHQASSGHHHNDKSIKNNCDPNDPLCGLK